MFPLIPVNLSEVQPAFFSAPRRPGCILTLSQPGCWLDGTNGGERTSGGNGGRVVREEVKAVYSRLCDLGFKDVPRKNGLN